MTLLSSKSLVYDRRDPTLPVGLCSPSSSRYVRYGHPKLWFDLSWFIDVEPTDWGELIDVMLTGEVHHASSDGPVKRKGFRSSTQWLVSSPQCAA